MFDVKTRNAVRSLSLGLFVGGISLISAGTLLAGESQEAMMHQTGMSHQDTPGWAEKLKGQTIVENSIEGRAERAALVEKQHEKMMQQIEKESAGTENSGMYNNMSTMHQYGAGMGNYLLASESEGEPVAMKGGGLCPKTAPVRHYDISSINVEITLNQWLDYYPGYMYALTENIEKIREEEEKNAEARESEGHHDPGGVKNGIQDQWIQPLVIRGNQGDCVKFTLRNQLEFGEAVSLHIHGSSMVMSKTGQPATTTNPDAVAVGLSEDEDEAPEGSTVIEMEWYIHPDAQEGGKQFHSYSNDRELTVMGMFGVFVVEPKGSEYLDPLGTGEAPKMPSGWQAIIKNGTGPDFREFVLIYHEVGDEAFRPVNKHGDFLPQRDPLTDTYRPGARALNYRSEPFGINNMHVQHEYFGFEDESMGYSSYTFGDAAPTIPRSYLGDPAKFRLVHGGSEVFHSHHPHGGSIRWARSPRAVDQMPMWHEGQGPQKYPVIRAKSDRVDVEVIGPAEAIDLETECGSGLCQYLAGDFLFHCHVAHHYVSGMWGYWRVYNSLQIDGFKNDVMPDLRELPDRIGRIAKPVTSDKLIGTTVNWFGKKFNIIEKGKSNWESEPAVVTIYDWVEMQLPTRGKPGHTDDYVEQIKSYDATVIDWVWDGNMALSEKEADSGENPKYLPEWQGYTAGERRPIWFEPSTGKVAWPWLTPHFGKRVPFSPDRNPAPWLEMIHLNELGTTSVKPAKPGENGRWSLCPDRAGKQEYNIHFIKLPIELSAAQGDQEAVVDPHGLLYVSHDQEEAIRGNNDLKVPLVFRANIYDCMDWILTSEWEDDDITNFQSSKINTHFHFVQFDNQASDGVISGFSYEQSMRPFTMLEKKSDKGLPVPMNATFTKAARQGERTIEITNAQQYHVGTVILVGADNVKGWEIKRIVAIGGKGSPSTASTSTKGGNDYTVSPGDTLGKIASSFGTSVGSLREMNDLNNENLIFVGQNLKVPGLGSGDAAPAAPAGENTLTFEQPLEHNHPVGDIVTVEFVRQRFWADADVGSVFCHDHAFGGTTWPHGAVCTFIIEPFGSTYHNPVTGEPQRIGPVVDIHTNEPVGYGVSGSFRELMVQIMDTVPHTVNVVTAGNPPGQPIDVALEAGRTVSFIMPPNEKIKMTPMPFLNGGTHTTGGALNFRAEPFAQRLANNPDTSQIFSSTVHGDPSTLTVRAYLGDAIVFRLVDVTMNESNVFTVSGHNFLTERYAGDANRKNSIHIGIAERYDLVVPQAGGPRLQAGDYMYFNGRSSKLSEGSWGLITVLDKKVPDLQLLPNAAVGGPGIKKQLPVCPTDAPVKSFNVAAIDFPSMTFNPNIEEAIEVDFERTIQIQNPDAKIFVLEDEISKASGDFHPMPLTIRANVGDCLKVNLTNKMKESRASFSAFSLAFDPKDSQGANIGNNPGDQTVAPGESRTYTYYADPFIGETQSLVWDFGNVAMNPRNGLFGGVIIGPKGSQYRDPKTGADISLKNSWSADVIIDRTIQGNEMRKNYRDVALYFQDEDNIIGTSFMPYVQNVAGLVGVNYRAEPYLYREEAGCTLGRMFQPCEVDDPKDPVTPLIEAHAGDPVRIHVFGASNEQNAMFSVEKHEWPIEPFMEGADQISVVEFAGSEGVDVFIPSAGGPYSMAADYVYSNQRLPYSQSGQWGYFRVLPTNDQRVLSLSGVAPGVKEAKVPNLDQGQIAPVAFK